MSGLVTTCRIIRFCDRDAQVNDAFEEAILIARHEGQPLDTVRIWQNRRAVVLASNADARASVDKDACVATGIAIVRRTSWGSTVYQDEGTLNLTLVIDQKKFFPDTDSLTEVYRQLWQPAVDAISKFGAGVETPYYGEDAVVNGAKISEAWVKFYYNLMLFQLSVNVHTDLGLLNQVLKQQGTFTTLSSKLNRTIRTEDIEKALIDAIARQFAVEFDEQKVSPLEKKLSDRLYEVKYSKDDWNFDAKAPLSLKDVLVEAYVAYPPTTSCREIIENIRSAIRDLQDKVELRVWMRGKGLNGHGPPPGVPMSVALMQACKGSIIPAVIINGQLAFSRRVESAEAVRDKILQALAR